MPVWIIYILIPLISGLIGWLTNRVAIQMLFHPRKAWSLGPVRIQGLVPKRQEELAQTTGEIVERELLNSHILRKELQEIDLGPYLETYATSLIHDGVAPRLRAIPLLGSFVNDRILASLERIAAEEMIKAAPALVAKFSTEAELHFRVKDLIADRIRNYDLDQLESLVRSLASREFRAIEILGGVLGFIIGLAQTLILFLLHY
jgi:uncharacterized membrane protein YheB (UPF0754 family)